MVFLEIARTKVMDLVIEGLLSKDKVLGRTTLEDLAKSYYPSGGHSNCAPLPL